MPQITEQLDQQVKSDTQIVLCKPNTMDLRGDDDSSLPSTVGTSYAGGSGGPVIKISIGGDGGQIRRVPARRLVKDGGDKVSYGLLRAVIARYAFPDKKVLPQNCNVTTTYIDEDGDAVVISTDEELEDALAAVVTEAGEGKKQILKIDADVMEKFANGEPHQLPCCSGHFERKIAAGRVGELQWDLLAVGEGELNDESRDAADRLVRDIVGSISLGGRSEDAAMDADPEEEGEDERKKTEEEDKDEKLRDKEDEEGEGNKKRKGEDGVCADGPLEFIHGRHTCDVCGATPIIGVRYHATDRPDFDLCQGCFANPSVPAGDREKFVTEELDRDRAMQHRWARRFANRRGRRGRRHPPFGFGMPFPPPPHHPPHGPPPPFGPPPHPPHGMPVPPPPHPFGPGHHKGPNAPHPPPPPPHGVHFPPTQPHPFGPTPPPPPPLPRGMPFPPPPHPHMPRHHHHHWAHGPRSGFGPDFHVPPMSPAAQAASGDMKKAAEQKQDDTNKELQEAVFRSMQDKQKQVSEEEECKDSEAKEETMGATNSEGNQTKPAMSSGVDAVEVEDEEVQEEIEKDVASLKIGDEAPDSMLLDVENEKSGGVKNDDDFNEDNESDNSDWEDVGAKDDKSEAASDDGLGLSSSDIAPPVLARWAEHLGVLRQLGFTDDHKSAEALETLQAANLGVDSTDEVTVGDAVNYLLKNADE